MDVIREVKYRIYPTISKYLSHATLLEGKLSNTDEIFRCLFVENTDLMSYMIPRMYQGTPAFLKTWRIYIPFLKKILRSASDLIDMCIAVFPLRHEPEFQKLANFMSQTLIRSFIDTSDGWEKVRQRFHYNKRQFSNKMEKNPMFSYRISNNLRDFDLFYNEMYVPHIQKRFQALAALDSYDQMKDWFLKGFLLLIEEENKTIAGVLCLIEDDILFFQRTGVLNGDEKYIRRGVSSGEYYFILKFALEHGISKVELLRSRPFFNDGVYSTKRNWGAVVYPDHESERIFFFIPEYSQKVANFFKINPLIIQKEDKLYGLVGWNGENPPNMKDEKEFNEKYYSPGLHGLMLIQPHSENLIQVPFK